METTERLVLRIRNWAEERMKDDSVSFKDAQSIKKEYCEWLEPDVTVIEVMSLMDQIDKRL